MIEHRPGSGILKLLRPQLLMATLLVLSATRVGRGDDRTIRISLDWKGRQGYADSGLSACAVNGRYVAFVSRARLVDHDTNAKNDVFVRDVLTGTTTRVSVASDGTQANGASDACDISADGRYVVFQSDATNLVPGLNDKGQVFIHDRRTGETGLVSVSTDGEQGNEWSGHPRISADGSAVVFSSYASNLVADDDNGESDVFVRDLVAGETTRVSVNSKGEEANGPSDHPALSVDGHYVVFSSAASNLVAGDTNRSYDGFLHDRQTGKTERVTVNSNQQKGSTDSYAADVSADGRYVLFESGAENMGDGGCLRPVFYLRDREARHTYVITRGLHHSCPTGLSALGSMSVDARFICFSSTARNLVEGDTNRKGDVFVYDFTSKVTTRVSVSSDGEQANDGSWYGRISANGRFVVFASVASNLVDDDTNKVQDAFRHEYRDCANFVRGDSNCDGVVDSSDIEGFVLALADPDRYGAAFLSCDWECNNDLNGDGVVDFNDIDPFVECLINGGCP